MDDDSNEQGAMLQNGQLDMLVLFKAMLDATKFKKGKLRFVARLGEQYRKEWNIQRACEIARTERDSPWRNWWDVPECNIPPPPLVPEWDDVCAQQTKLVLVNLSGFNYDIRSRAEEYAHLFHMDEDDVRDCDQDDWFFKEFSHLKQPKWYRKWSGVFYSHKANRGHTFRDLARGLSDIKSGKQDKYYELLGNVHVAFPNHRTLLVAIDFNHGS